MWVLLFIENKIAPFWLVFERFWWLCSAFDYGTS